MAEAAASDVGYKLALILEGDSGGREPNRYEAPHTDLIFRAMLRKEAKATTGKHPGL